MSDSFKQTSVTLLQRIAIEKTGEDEATWVRFWELYHPAMLMFAKSIGGGQDSEDIVQEVLAKLVDSLKHGKYERQEGTLFRSYLKTLIRRQLIDVYRREKARGLGRNVELTEEIVEDASGDLSDIGERLDADWVRACHNAAVNHVMERSALSKQSKDIYREYALENQPIAEVAKRHKVTKNLVSQIKVRVDRMVSSQMAEYGD